MQVLAYVWIASSLAAGLHGLPRPERRLRTSAAVTTGALLALPVTWWFF